jgi:NAD(P)-dependent dehydrogenase (short-subunit alcohol dehydrogenase family)
MQEHASRIALVTGAASGIGRTISEQLALVDGAAVCVVDRDAAAARETAAFMCAQHGRDLGGESPLAS